MENYLAESLKMNLFVFDFSFFTMRLSTLFPLAIAALALHACNDDDDQNGAPPPAVTFPHSMQFDQVSDVSLQLWVGGTPQNTQGMSIQDFVSPEDYDELFTMNTNATFVFTADSVSAPALDDQIIAYTFNGDSLIVFLEGPSGNIPFLLGVGNFFEFKTPLGFVRYCSQSDLVSMCSEQGGAFYFSPDDGLELVNLDSIDQMGPNDSLLVYSHFWVFKHVP